MRSDGTENTAAHEFRTRPNEVSEKSPSDTASHPEDINLQEQHSARPKDCTLI